MGGHRGTQQPTANRGQPLPTQSLLPRPSAAASYPSPHLSYSNLAFFSARRRPGSLSR